MKEQFLDKKVEDFSEYEYPFINVFLKEIFGERNAMRRYSLAGEGIFNLIYLEDKIYEVKFKEIKKMLINDNKKALRDATKDFIVEKICKVLQENNIEYATNSGKFISFKLNKYIAQIEIIKKLKEPENLGKTRINGEWV